VIMLTGVAVTLQALVAAGVLAVRGQAFHS
jgi:hypothetical protein